VHKVDRLESGSENNEIELLAISALDLDSRLRDFGNMPCFQPAVWFRESREKVVRQDDPLAARRVVGRQFLPHLRIVGKCFHERRLMHSFRKRCHLRLLLRNGVVERFTYGHEYRTLLPPDGRDPSIYRLPQARNDGILTEHYPARRPLVHRDMLRYFDNFGNNLSGRSAVTDNADALSR